MSVALRTVLVGVFAGSASALAAAELPEHPNVLMIVLDDLNHWVGHLGRNRQTKTPAIDRLAARGVSFRHAYCAAPVCNPSRAAMMSGLRPHQTGVYDNGDDWRPMIPEDVCLTTAFRRAGYFVAGAGKIYHGGYPRLSEWDDYLKDEGSNPAPQGDRGVGGIRFAPLDCRDGDLQEGKIVEYGIEQLRKRHEKPFFLTIGLHKPHMPWNVPRKYYDLHPLSEIELPPHRDDDLADIPPAGVALAKPAGDHATMLESGRWKEAVQGYLAAISYADAMVGRLLEALDRSAYAKNTIIMLWGDHGWHLGEKQHWRKFALWEETTRTPLVWVVPGLTRAGSVCDRTVDAMSIYPTLTDLAGIPTPGHVAGRSLRPLLADPGAAWDQPALTTFGFQNHALRSAEWRYIRYANGDEELYDERHDPYEWTNLAGDSAREELRATFKRQLPADNHPAAGKRGAKKKAKQRAGGH
jgi:arylsulfatase A-like enzyme